MHQFKQVLQTSRVAIWSLNKGFHLHSQGEAFRCVRTRLSWLRTCPKSASCFKWQRELLSKLLPKGTVLILKCDTAKAEAEWIKQMACPTKRPHVQMPRRWILLERCMRWVSLERNGSDPHGSPSDKKSLTHKCSLLNTTSKHESTMCNHMKDWNRYASVAAGDCKLANCHKWPRST